MEIYKINSVEDLTPQLVANLVQRYKMNEVPRMERLHRYYNAKSDVKNRVMADPAKPNNKIANPYASYITDTATAYFMSKPVVYNSLHKDYLDSVTNILKANNESSHNSRMAKEMSISGVAYELVYLDEEKQICFSFLDPRNTFMIYDNTIKQNPVAGVYFYTSTDYTTNESVDHIHFYTTKGNFCFTCIGDKFSGIEEEKNLFNKVPVTCYKNNDELLGDFEKIIDLIDAYDLAVSDTSNSLEYFADAYLILSNAEGTDEEDIAVMKENRVILLPENGKADWLIKGSANVEVEEFKNRLKDDIHTLSQVPNLNDDAFGTATSGESLKYKLFGLENIVANKESKFREALQNRIAIINNFFALKNQGFDNNAITINFTRNLPVNHTQLVDMIIKLEHILSHETLLSQLPFVDDVELEKDRIEKERQDSLYSDFPVEEQEAELSTIME